MSVKDLIEGIENWKDSNKFSEIYRNEPSTFQAMNIIKHQAETKIKLAIRRIMA